MNEWMVKKEYVIYITMKLVGCYLSVIFMNYMCNISLLTSGYYQRVIILWFSGGYIT